MGVGVVEGLPTDYFEIRPDWREARKPPVKMSISSSRRAGIGNFA